MSDFIYVDHAATTKVRPEVLEAMMPYLTEYYGNVSSMYSISDITEQAVKDARASIAAAIGAKEQEIIFTSCGSESNNMALRGIMKKAGGGHIITTNVEHHAILHTVEALVKEGCTATYLPVDERGLITPDQLEAAITPETKIISIMMANNEIGTIEPIQELAAVAKAHGIYFHTDAVQAVGHLPINVKEMGIDMLSASGHKFGAPKGIGFLYVRNGIYLPALITGGGQERGKRAGTENTAFIVGMAKALELAVSEMDKTNARLLKMRERLIDGILESIPYCRLNGDRERRVAGNVNVSIEFIEGEALLLMLDMNGICASSGSACTTGSLDPSHVLLAIGLTHEVAHGSLRISLGEDNTQADVDYILKTLPPIVKRLRDMSPVWEDAIKAGIAEDY
ncbi:MAG: cysteine desulfurase NifS [Clostridia bacterium]|nr:cysteine desulfurase NifS [Clostridia bacterium]